MNVDDMNGVGTRVLHAHRRKRVNQFVHRARALRFKARGFLNKTRNSKLIALIKERRWRLHKFMKPLREGSGNAKARKLLANSLRRDFALTHAFLRDGFIFVEAGPLCL